MKTNRSTTGSWKGIYMPVICLSALLTMQLAARDRVERADRTPKKALVVAKLGASSGPDKEGTGSGSALGGPSSASPQDSAPVQLAFQTIAALEIMYHVSDAAPEVMLSNGQPARPLPFRDISLEVSIGNHLRQLELQEDLLKREGKMTSSVAGRVKEIRKRILNWNR